jgi:hypothetical protein
MPVVTIGLDHYADLRDRNVYHPMKERILALPALVTSGQIHERVENGFAAGGPRAG